MSASSRSQRRSHPSPRLIAGIGALAVGASLYGCGQLRYQATADDPAIAEQVQAIEPFDLALSSDQPPAPIESVEEVLPLDLAPEPPPVSRDVLITDVRQAVLENQFEIRVELINPSIAQTVVDEEAARFDLVFGASLDRTRTETDADISGIAVDSTVEVDNFQYGVTVPLKSGTTVSIGMPVQRTTTEDEIANTDSEFFDTQAAVSVTHPLLRGGGLAVNTAPITRAKLSLRQVDSRTKLQIINLLANAERAYWLHWSAAEEVEIRYEQYNLALRQLDHARQLADAGLVPKVEILRSEVGVSSRVENIIIAETNRRLRERELKRVMNVSELPVGGETALIPSTEPTLNRLFLSPAFLIEQASKNRMELLDLQLQLAIDELDLDVARNAELPELAFSFDYSFRGTDDNFDDSLGNLEDQRTWAAGLVFEIPIGNNAANARRRRAALRYISSLTSRQRQQQLVEQDVYDTVDQIEQNWQRILAARQETRLAEAIYQAEIKQFIRGLRTSTEVLDAAQLLADAQVRNVRAMADYEISKLELAFATGTQLGASRVDIAPLGLEAADELRIPEL